MVRAEEANCFISRTETGYCTEQLPQNTGEKVNENRGLERGRGGTCRELGERQLWRRKGISAASAGVQPSFGDQMPSSYFHVKVLNLVPWL